jgi:hypothetical protein
MKKTITSAILALMLASCGGNDQDQETVIPENLYAVDRFTGAVDAESTFVTPYVNGKIYSFDENKNLYINYSNLPIFKTEVLRQIITPDYFLSEKSAYLEQHKYWVGSRASFKNDELSYSLSSDRQNIPFILSWKYKKLDVSGRPITDDSNNPIHRLGTTAQIMAIIYGIGYEATDTFPQGSVCWQKQSASSSHEYIDFYPKRIISHVEDTQEVVRSGVWNNVTWIEFQRQEGESALANIKLEIEGDIYWGFYHFKNESLIQVSDQLACDFMNETAFTAFSDSFSKHKKVNEALNGNGSK